MIAEMKYNLKGITSYTTYPSGEMKECKLGEYNEICIGPNTLIPRYKGVDERKKDNKAVSFYENGNIKSISLEEQTEIATSIGTISSELITFYEDGAINSLFPLNGQIGFGWSEEDEEQLLKELELDLTFAKFQKKIIGLRFYQTGEIKSIILWPRENIDIDTPLGSYPVRIGLRMYENGNLESFEPARAVVVPTPIGDIVAFDQNALGMDADNNSVNFYLDGNLRSIATNSDIVVNNKVTGERTMIYQQLRLDMLTNEMVKLPVKISFESNSITIDSGAESMSFDINTCKFLFLYDGSYKEKKCSPGSDCSGCGAACM
ncbi:hypothetical protein [Anaerosporobacter sp.]